EAILFNQAAAIEQGVSGGFFLPKLADRHCLVVSLTATNGDDVWNSHFGMFLDLLLDVFVTVIEFAANATALKLFDHFLGVGGQFGLDGHNHRLNRTEPRR